MLYFKKESDRNVLPFSEAMASQTQGIQHLLGAEKRAAEKVPHSISVPEEGIKMKILLKGNMSRWVKLERERTGGLNRQRRRWHKYDRLI